MVGTIDLVNPVAGKLQLPKTNPQGVSLSQLSKSILKPGPVIVSALDVIDFSCNQIETLDALVRRNPRVSLVLSEINYNALTTSDIGNNILARAKKIDVIPAQVSFTSSYAA